MEKLQILDLRQRGKLFYKKVKILERSRLEKFYAIIESYTIGKICRNTQKKNEERWRFEMQMSIYRCIYG